MGGNIISEKSVGPRSALCFRDAFRVTAALPRVGVGERAHAASADDRALSGTLAHSAHPARALCHAALFAGHLRYLRCPLLPPPLSRPGSLGPPAQDSASEILALRKRVAALEHEVNGNDGHGSDGHGSDGKDDNAKVYPRRAPRSLLCRVLAALVALAICFACFGLALVRGASTKLPNGVEGGSLRVGGSFGSMSDNEQRIALKAELGRLRSLPLPKLRAQVWVEHILVG